MKPEEDKPEKIREELADVIAYALLLAHECNLDVTKIVEEKIRRNAEKYLVVKVKGIAKHYLELGLFIVQRRRSFKRIIFLAK